MDFLSPSLSSWTRSRTYPLVEVDGVLAGDDLVDRGLGGLLSLVGRHF